MKWFRKVYEARLIYRELRKLCLYEDWSIAGLKWLKQRNNKPNAFIVWLSLITVVVHKFLEHWICTYKQLRHYIILT